LTALSSFDLVDGVLELRLVGNLLDGDGVAEVVSIV